MAGGSGVENCTVVGVVGGRGTSVGFNFIYFINLCVLTCPDLSGLRWARLSVLASSHIVLACGGVNMTWALGGAGCIGMVCGHEVPVRPAITTVVLALSACWCSWNTWWCWYDR
jgi:hypothetical protein